MPVTTPAQETDPAAGADTVAALREVRLGLQRVWHQANRLAGSASRRPAVADWLDTALVSGRTAKHAHAYHDHVVVPTARRVRTLTAGQLRRFRAAEEHLTGQPATRWLDDPTAHDAADQRPDEAGDQT